MHAGASLHCATVRVSSVLIPLCATFYATFTPLAKRLLCHNFCVALRCAVAHTSGARKRCKNKNNKKNFKYDKSENRISRAKPLENSRKATSINIYECVRFLQGISTKIFQTPHLVVRICMFAVEMRMKNIFLPQISLLFSFKAFLNIFFGFSNSHLIALRTLRLLYLTETAKGIIKTFHSFPQSVKQLSCTNVSDFLAFNTYSAQEKDC